ncbi:MAG TPA: FAD-binding oxidoreductase [Streptosporangiaceae bacterium]|jgi:glycine/D-amino acid oxidase-like deaminating enzyme
MDADLVVIGAGALGLSTALHAALLGRRPVVVERHTAGSQASGRAAGLFKSVQADELRTRLARRSIDLALTFPDWAGGELVVTRSGSFLIARTDQHKTYLQTEARQSALWGVDVRAAQPGELASRLSYYRGDGHEYALWCPEDIYIEEPISLIRAYLAAGRLHGVEVLESEAVTGVIVSGGRVTGVETTKRSIAAPVVVDAAGAWTRQVAELAGGEVAVAPVRHQLLITEPADAVSPADPIARIVDAAVYLRPARAGLMAGAFEAAPLPLDPRAEASSFSTDDVPLDIGVLQAMARHVAREVPMVSDAVMSNAAASDGAVTSAVAEHRGGLFTMTPDGRFVTGPAPDVPGLWVASGCNGSGFSSSLAIGEALAGWICGQNPRVDISALSPGRFGPVTDEALVKAGVWQYAHYYDPAAS